MPTLPSWLLTTIKFFLKRPSDRQIRFLRILFGLALISALWDAHGRYVLLPEAWAPYDPIAQWTLMVLAFPALWIGITNQCVAKKKIVRLGQLSLAIILFSLGSWLMRDLPKIESVTVPAPSVATDALAPVTRTGSFADALAAGNTITPPPSRAGTGSFDQVLHDLSGQSAGPVLPVGFWIWFLAWFPLAAGITGKMITSKCQKYGEKITKIRV